MLRPLLVLSRQQRVKTLVTRLPLTRGIVTRFVAGETIDDAVACSRSLVASGLLVSLDHLGEDTTTFSRAEQTTAEYLRLLQRLADEGLAGSVEVSLKLSAVGQFLPENGERTALRNARTICAAASDVGTTVTVDMEGHLATASTLVLVDKLREGYPRVGTVVQAALRRTETDVDRMATPGRRVRLCKGAYEMPPDVAYPSAHEVALSYVRCLRTLVDGPGYPMIATHDPRLIAIAERLVTGRGFGSYEFQMLYGVRPAEQQRLAAAGHQVRVYVPYGSDWYGYLMRRLAERPANLAFFLRALWPR